MRRELRLPLSVAAVSAAIIAFQLVQMQLLAVAQWHHFAAMVISLALLGFGAAGTALALWRPWFVRRCAVALPLLYAGCGVAMAGTVWLAGTFGRFDAYLLFFDPAQLALLLASTLIHALPFFCGALAMTLVFDREVGRIGVLYFASLAGSGAGAAGVLALLWLLPPPQLAGVLALLPLLAAWLMRPPAWPARHTAVVALAALAVPVAAVVAPAAPQPSQYKPIHAALLLPGAQVVHRAHGPYGQLEVVRAGALRFAPAPSLRYTQELPVRDVVFVDGQTFGTLVGRADAGRVLDQGTQGLPYALRTPPSVLVLDAATGTDVAHALSHGARRITAVEPNGQVNQLLRDLRPQWIDGAYRDPAVRLVGTSARAHLGAARGESHDLVVLPALGAFGGTSGVHALQENYALTLQAFDAIWQALAADGMLALTVWDDQPPRLGLRLLWTLRAALERQGVAEVRAHLLAVRSWGTVTYVASKRRWTADEIERARRFARERAFDPLILPRLEPGERERFNRLPDRAYGAAVDALVDGDPAALFAHAPFDLRPTTDDRPFFDHFVRWSGLPQLHAAYGARELPYLELGFVFGVVGFVQVVLAALLLIVLPLVRVGWAGTRRRWTLLYFAGTGIGYMLLEIVLMQRLVLYLGHPVHAAAAVLTVLLLGSGVGSLVSSRLQATPRLLATAGVVIAALIALYAQLLTPALASTMGWPLAAKAAAVLLWLAPPAFALGLMFPLGLRRLAGSDDTHIAWACGIDHCLSVAAAAGATLLALEAGFGAVMGVAAAAYLVVAIAGTRLGRSG